MKQILILFLVISLFIGNQNFEDINTLILPNRKNMFTAFQFELYDFNDVRADLLVNCSSDMQKNGLKYFGYNLCGHQFKKEKVSELNMLLQKLSINTDQNSTTRNNMKVEYFYRIYKNKNEETMHGKIIQNIELINEVPITQLIYNLQLNNQNDQYIETKLLEIDSAYITNTNIKNLTITYPNKEFPKWIKFEFKENALYLKGKIPKSNTDENIIKFYISDNKTLLKSRYIEFKISFGKIPVYYSKITIMIASILLFMIVFFLIYFLLQLKNYNKSIENKNVIELKSNKANSSAILTNSIVNWDKCAYKNEVDSFRSTRDITDLDIETSELYNFNDRSKVIDKSIDIIEDESLMKEIEQFTSIIKQNQNNIN